MGGYSDFLFATPTFASGAASAFDLGALMFVFNSVENGQLADELALRSDWRAVGAELRRALERHQADGGDGAGTATKE